VSLNNINGRTKCGWEDNIKMNLKEIMYLCEYQTISHLHNIAFEINICINGSEEHLCF
jgi:hypothetical protein